MTSRFRISRAATVALSLFLLILSASGQVSVSSALYQEKECVPGDSYEVKVVVYNSSPEAVEILVIQQDYSFDQNKHRFMDCGKLERSNCSWIEVKHTRMLLLGQRKETLVFPVHVPDDAKPGSYHSVLGIKTKPAKVEKKAQMSLRMSTKINIQVVSLVTHEKARKELVLSKTEVVNDSLFLTVKNIGEVVLKFRIVPPIPGIQSDRKARIYPNQEQKIELKIDKLSDGQYKQLRFLLDDGKVFIQAIFVTFVKGKIAELAELRILKGEELRKKRGRAKAARPVRLNAILSWGTNYKAVNLSGSMNLFRNVVSLTGGSSYREFDNYISDEMLTYRAGTAVRLKNLRVSYSAYFFESSCFEMISGSYRYKNFNMNMNYTLDRDIFHGSVSQRFWKRWSLRINTYFDFKTDRKRATLSLSIPII